MVFPDEGLKGRGAFAYARGHLGVSLRLGLRGEPVGRPRNEVQQQDPDEGETLEVETTAAVAVEN